MNGLALCSGIGGIELGLRLALGSSYTTVCYVERDVYCASLLAQRMEEGFLDQAPIWSDVETFSGKPWSGVVHCVTGGIPCQPWSRAGQHGGTEDDRWIWSDIERILGDLSPSIIFLENVPDLALGGLEHIATFLASSGFSAEWDCFQAQDVGAPQKRERLFLLAMAHPVSEGLEKRIGIGGNAPPKLPTAERIGLPLFPPPPDRPEDFRSGLEPCIRGRSSGVSTRMDRIHALGNSVVPLVAAYAFNVLFSRIKKGDR